MNDLRQVAQQALEALESVLCDPEGKCCIDGSDADRAVVDKELAALRAALAQQAEPEPEPVAWRVRRRSEKFWDVSQHKPLDAMQDNRFEVRALVDAVDQQQAEPVAWLRVIDEAMVVHHLGVADPTDDYETAKRKMNTLLCMAQDIGADFAKQAEPVQRNHYRNLWPERNFCSRCGKRLADEGIHTCTPPQTKCSHCASPLFAALECRVCGRKPEWVCPESGEKTYDRPGHCDDCGLTLVRKETK